MSEPRLLKLNDIGDGVASELFDEALAEVLANIKNPNTDWRPKRKISLEFTFACDEFRELGLLDITAKKTLAGVKGVKLQVVYGTQNGKPVAVESPKQTDMFPKEPTGPIAVVGRAKEG